MKITSDEFHLAIRDLEDGNTLYIRRMTFQKFRLNIGATGTLSYKDGW